MIVIELHSKNIYNFLENFKFKYKKWKHRKHNLKFPENQLFPRKSPYDYSKQTERLPLRLCKFQQIYRFSSQKDCLLSFGLGTSSCYMTYTFKPIYYKLYNINFAPEKSQKKGYELFEIETFPGWVFVLIFSFLLQFSYNFCLFWKLRYEILLHKYIYLYLRRRYKIYLS